MTTPILESIAVNIETTLAGITTAAGYNQTLYPKRSKRVDFGDASFLDCHVLIIQGKAENAKSPTMCEAYLQPFTLGLSIINSDKSTESVDIRINKAVADIIKAVLVDPRRGGYAKNTTVKPATLFLDGSGVSTGADIDIEVLYYTAYNDPYTLR
jgi:hypothetical protein